MQVTSSTLTAGDTIFKLADNCLIPTGIFGTLHDANLLSCASNCVKDQACVSFEYFNTNPSCLMSSAYIESDSCTSVGSMYQSSKKDTITLRQKHQISCGSNYNKFYLLFLFGCLSTASSYGVWGLASEV